MRQGILHRQNKRKKRKKEVQPENGSTSFLTPEIIVTVQTQKGESCVTLRCKCLQNCASKCVNICNRSFICADAEVEVNLGIFGNLI